MDTPETIQKSFMSDGTRIVHKFPKLQKGFLLKRYKRFLADVRLDCNCEQVVCYIANPGSMLGMVPYGSEVRLQDHHCDETPNNLKPRKFRYSIEAICVNNVWIGTNTLLPNHLIYSMLSEPVLHLPLKSKFEQILSSTNSFCVEKEVSIKELSSNTRFDFLIYNEQSKASEMNPDTFTAGSCLCEVKQVTMASDWWPIEVGYPSAMHPERKISVLMNNSRTFLDNNYGFASSADRRIQNGLNNKRKRKHRPDSEYTECNQQGAIEFTLLDIPFECRTYIDVLQQGSHWDERHLNQLSLSKLMQMRGILPKIALFPDSRTERGQKHLRELLNWVNSKFPVSRRKELGRHASVMLSDTHRNSCMLYYIARGDCTNFNFSQHCDYQYFELVKKCSESSHFHILPLVFEYNMSDPSNSYVAFKEILKFAVE